MQRCGIMDSGCGCEALVWTAPSLAGLEEGRIAELGHFRSRPTVAFPRLDSKETVRWVFSHPSSTGSSFFSSHEYKFLYSLLLPAFEELSFCHSVCSWPHNHGPKMQHYAPTLAVRCPFGTSATHPRATGIPRQKQNSLNVLSDVYIWPFL